MLEHVQPDMDTREKCEICEASILTLLLFTQMYVMPYILDQSVYSCVQSL